VATMPGKAEKRSKPQKMSALNFFLDRRAEFADGRFQNGSPPLGGKPWPPLR
jgi:hypothetical protein